MNYMHYRSTRGGEKKTFADILSSGLAADGGLYEPTRWPHHRRLRGFLAANPTFPQVVGAVVGVFAGRRSLPQLDFTAIAHKAFETFHSRAVVPLREVERNLWLLELFHGPTLSFKDIPLQFYGQLLEALASQRKRLLIMIGATSGDTGSAAIEALTSVRGVRLFMLHPKERISALQRKQMTCSQAPHICNIAVDGSYDDCLRLVKTMAQSEAIQARGQVSAVNSFNWIRIAVQSAVYLYAAQRVSQHAKSTRFALASGNFGNAYAGYVAKKLGANIEGLTLAVGRNDFLHTLFRDGAAASGEVVPSLAPSIDIMTPNNIERLLFRALGESARKWNKLREQAEESGTLRVPRGALRSEIFQFFRTQRFDDEHILEAMSQAYDSVGEPLDPHSAIALKAARDACLETDKRNARELCTVAFATAAAAKFPETLERAIGTRPHIPARLAELETRAENYETIPADDEALESIIVARLSKSLDSDASLQAEEGLAAATSTSAATSTAAATTTAGLATEGEEKSDQEESGQPHDDAGDAGDADAATSATVTEDAQEKDQEKDEATHEETDSFSSSPSSSMPEMPAVAALTTEEDSLEKKIAHLKEQTAQLDESLESPAISSPSSASASASASALADDPFATPTPSFDATTRVGETQEDLTQEGLTQEDLTQTKTGDEEPTMRSASIFSDATSPPSPPSSPPPSAVSGDTLSASDDGIVSLADAAEQGQASLQEKIAKLREQSAKLDEAAGEAHSPFETDTSSSSSSYSSSSFAPSPSFSEDSTSAQEATQKAEQGAEEQVAEQEAEKTASGLAGAENFFPSPAASTETAEATESSETSSTTSPTAFSWKTPLAEGEEKT